MTLILSSDWSVDLHPPLTVFRIYLGNRRKVFSVFPTESKFYCLGLATCEELFVSEEIIILL